MSDCSYEHKAGAFGDSYEAALQGDRLARRGRCADAALLLVQARQSYGDARRCTTPRAELPRRDAAMGIAQLVTTMRMSCRITRR